MQMQCARRCKPADRIICSCMGNHHSWIDSWAQVQAMFTMIMLESQLDGVSKTWLSVKFCCSWVLDMEIYCRAASVVLGRSPGQWKSLKIDSLVILASPKFNSPNVEMSSYIARASVSGCGLNQFIVAQHPMLQEVGDTKWAEKHQKLIIII